MIIILGKKKIRQVRMITAKRVMEIGIIIIILVFLCVQVHLNLNQMGKKHK